MQMQCSNVAVGCLLLLAGAVSASAISPIEKVVSLLNELKQKVISDGEQEEAAYREYYSWCDDTAFAKTNEIKSTQKHKGKLEAAIEKASSDIQDSSSKIEDFSAALLQDEADLKAATEIRHHEKAHFEKGEEELLSAIDMLGRASSILEKETEEKSASLVQTAVDTPDLESVLTGVAAVVDAAGGDLAASGRKLVALLETRQAAAVAPDALDEFGDAPKPAYESHSDGILELIDSMREKAEQQLSESRKAEAKAQHNFDLLKMSLEDSIAETNKELDEERVLKEDAQSAKAVAEGDLSIATKQLADAKEALEMARQDCMQKAADHDATIRGRTEELKALQSAITLIEENTGGADKQTYSLVQLAMHRRSGAPTSSRGNEVLKIVKHLAHESGSVALSQLASRIQAVVRFGSAAGEDPFKKVKELISDMITKLSREQKAEAEEKAYCDEEMAKTQMKKGDLEDTTDGLKAKVDEAAAAAAALREEVRELQADLAKLEKGQATMDLARQDGHKAFKDVQADLTQGLSGIRAAIKVLRDYYGSSEEGAALIQADSSTEVSTDVTALMQQPEPPVQHSASAGAGGGIIGLLQVIEADLAKELAEEETEEQSAQAKYDEMTQENKVTKAQKGKDVEHKTAEFKALDKYIAETTGDLSTATSELTAVNEFFEKLKERCIAKPEPFEERKKRREEEIAGLQEALSILEGENAFLQRRRKL